MKWKYQTERKKKTDNDWDIENTQNGTDNQGEVKEHFKKKIDFVNDFSFRLWDIFCRWWWIPE